MAGDPRSSLSSYALPIGEQSIRAYFQPLFKWRELLTFFVLEWDESVLQIKDQYLLDLAGTQKLAKKLDIRHPAVCVEDIIMTTDFVVYFAIDGRRMTKALRPSKQTQPQEVSDKRTQEKIELERGYWESCGFFYEVVYAADYPELLVSNLRQLFRWRNQKGSPRDLDEHGRSLTSMLRSASLFAS